MALTAKLHFVHASPAIKFCYMDTCMIGHLEDLVTGVVTYKGYFLQIDDAPGLGADIDSAFLKNCKTFSV